MAFWVQWGPPEISIVTGLGEFEGHWAMTNVPVAPLAAKVRAAILAYNAGSEAKFSFYDEFGIPPYSFVGTNYWNRSLYDDEAGRREVLSVKQFIMNKLFVANDGPLGSPYIYTPRYGDYIHFRYNREYPMFPGADDNKIHLYVKQDSILYVICKLAQLHTHYPENSLVFKFSIFNRLSHLQEGGDPGVRELSKDGGTTGTFVIYGMSDPAGMTEMIQHVLALFPNHEELGLMDLRGRDTISPFHVRLNRMVSYSSTDRGKALDGFEREMRTRAERVRPLPPWLYDMQSKCEEEGWEEVNRKSQFYLGIDLCSEHGPLDYKTLCAGVLTPAELICFLPTDLLDPRTLAAVPAAPALAAGNGAAVAALVAGNGAAAPAAALVAGNGAAAAALDAAVVPMGGAGAAEAAEAAFGPSGAVTRTNRQRQRQRQRHMQRQRQRQTRKNTRRARNNRIPR